MNQSTLPYRIGFRTESPLQKWLVQLFVKVCCANCFGVLQCMCRKGNFNFDMRIFQNISAKHKIIVDWDSYRPFEYSPSDDICIKNKTSQSIYSHYHFESKFDSIAVLYFDDNIHFKFADILVVWVSACQLQLASILNFFSLLASFWQELTDDRPLRSNTQGQWLPIRHTSIL